MANPEHLEILKKGVDVWNKWREENSIRCPDLIDANLFNANPGKYNLFYANLSYAILRNADLCGANLRNADLSGADLRNAHLRNTDLRSACLGGINLKNANLDRAIIGWSTFIDEDPKRCDFTKTFGPIESTVALDCTEGFSDWKIGVTSKIAIKNPEREAKIKYQARTPEEREKKLAELDSELAQLRAELAEAKDRNLKQPDTHDYSEYETRKLIIDLLLREAGWTIGDDASEEYPVTGMPNETGIPTALIPDGPRALS